MKIFYIDLDGTLLKKPDYNFTSTDVKALKKAQERGSKFGIASGRSHVEIDYLEREHGLTSDLTIGLNGMVIKKDEDLIISKLDQEVLDVLLKHNIDFEAQDGGNRVFSSQREHDFIPKVLGTNMVVTRELEKFDIKKIVIRQLFNERPLDEIKGIIEGACSAKYNYFCIDNKTIEIVRKDVSKGNAIMEHFSDSEVIAIGDSHNDREMILLADQGYIMKNALPELRKELKEKGAIEIGDVFEAVEVEIADIKGILFDLDGVIADTANYHYLAWREVAKRYNIELCEEFNENLKGVSRRESLEKILSLGDIVLPEEEFRGVLKEKNDLYINYLEELGEDSILPGIKEFLIDLKSSDKKVAVASASKNAPYILEKLGLLKYIDYIADPGSIERGKPAPDIFLDAARGIGLKVDEVVGIEDSQAGVDALYRANMLSIGIGKLKNSLYNLESTGELLDKKTRRLIFKG